MTMPVLLTNFGERQSDGNRGEVRFAELCAQHLKRSQALFEIAFDEIHIRCREYSAPTKVEGISFFFDVGTKEEQIYGDLTLQVGGRQAKVVNVEVKTEAYRYGQTFDSASKTTPNVVFECFSRVMSASYEKHWSVNGKFRHRLDYANIGPDHFHTAGGHFVSKADWLVHVFKNNVIVCFPSRSLCGLRGLLSSNAADQFDWFCASTSTRSGLYYTIGKKIPVDFLIAENIAQLLEF